MCAQLKGFGILLLLLLAACSSSNRRLDYSTSTDFSRYQSYQIRLDDVEEVYTFFNNEQFIESRLLTKNLTRVTGESSPDFYLDLSIKYIGENNSMTLGLGVGGAKSTGNSSLGVGVSSGIPLGIKSVADVQIAIIDAQTEKLLWRNADEARYKDEEEKRQSVFAAIEKILSQFPPEKE